MTTIVQTLSRSLSKTLLMKQTMYPCHYPVQIPPPLGSLAGFPWGRCHYCLLKHPQHTVCSSVTACVPWIELIYFFVSPTKPFQPFEFSVPSTGSKCSKNSWKWMERMREGEKKKRRGKRKDFLNTSKLGTRYFWSDETVVCPHASIFIPCHKVMSIFLGHFTVMIVNTLKVLIQC